MEIKKYFKQNLALKALQITNELMIFYSAWLAGVYMGSFIVSVVVFNVLMLVSLLITLPMDIPENIDKITPPTETQLYISLSVNLVVCFLAKYYLG